MIRSTFLAACAALVFASFTFGSEPPAVKNPPAVKGADKYDARAACVSVAWKQWGGCGVAVAAEDGKTLVLTCNHIFDESSVGQLAPYPLACTVTVGGKTYPARAVGGDPDCDLALVVVDGTLPVARLAAAQPAVGTAVWREGRGTGFQTGTVARTDPRWVNESCKFFASSRSESGDSGAAYFTASGELVAIHCGRADGLSRGTPVVSLVAALRDRTPVLFPKLRERLGAKPAPMKPPEPPAIPAPKKVEPPKKAEVPKKVASEPPPVFASPFTSGGCVNGVCKPPARPRLFR